MFKAVAASGASDVFSELLHLQKHRRLKGIKTLSNALESNMLSRITALHICIPLGLDGFFQHKEAPHLGLAEQSGLMLSNAVRNVKWSDCFDLVKKVIGEIHRSPSNRHSYLITGLIEILTAFDYQVEDAAGKFIEAFMNQRSGGGTSSLTGAITASIASGRRKRVKPDEVKREVSHLDVDDSDEATDTNNSDVENNSDAESVNGNDDNDLRDESAITKDQLEHQVSDARDQVGRIQRSVREQLLPMLRRLLIEKQKKKADDGVSLPVKKVKDAVSLIRPQIVSLMLKVARYLPVEQFHLELPRLLGILGKCLA